MPEVKSYADLQCELAARGLIYCPITEQEFESLMCEGFGITGAVSVALDVHAGFSFLRASLIYLNDTIESELNA